MRHQSDRSEFGRHHREHSNAEHRDRKPCPETRASLIYAWFGALSGLLAPTLAATFLLTITNQMTILAFAAMFAGLGLADAPGAINATIVVAGVFLGSLLWWFLLSASVAFARRRLPEGFSLWVSRLSGVILIGFGLYALGSLLHIAVR